MAWGDGDGEGMQEDPKKVRLTHAVGQCGSVSMACPFRARLLVRRLASAVRMLQLATAVSRRGLTESAV